MLRLWFSGSFLSPLNPIPACHVPPVSYCRSALSSAQSHFALQKNIFRLDRSSQPTQKEVFTHRIPKVDAG